MAFAYNMTSLSDLTVPKERIMKLLRSGLGLKQILEICPELSAEEVERVMQYTAGLACAQFREIQPLRAEDDDEEEEERPRRQKARKETSLAAGRGDTRREKT